MIQMNFTKHYLDRIQKSFEFFCNNDYCFNSFKDDYYNQIISL